VQSALREGRARLSATFSTHPEDQESVGLCGGANDVFIEVLKPRPHLLILGAGHIGRELAKLAAALEMRISVVDDRAEYLVPGDYPPGTALVQIGYERESETLEALPDRLLTPNTYAVLATWGWDGPAMQQLSDPVSYWPGRQPTKSGADGALPPTCRRSSSTGGGTARLG
jgi:xanthine/CO dehydrogenase XdhC/CoxF family maturation factor